jgi:hypothetical protein
MMRWSHLCSLVTVTIMMMIIIITDPAPLTFRRIYASGLTPLITGELFARGGKTPKYVCAYVLAVGLFSGLCTAAIHVRRRRSMMMMIVMRMRMMMMSVSMSWPWDCSPASARRPSM